LKSAVAISPSLRSAIASFVWVGVSLAFVHLYLDTDRPRFLDLHAFLAIAALATFALAATTWFGTSARLRWLSLAAAVLASVIALALVATRVAHETGVAVFLGGAVIVVLSINTRGTRGEGKSDIESEGP